MVFVRDNIDNNRVDNMENITVLSIGLVVILAIMSIFYLRELTPLHECMQEHTFVYCNNGTLQ